MELPTWDIRGAGRAWSAEEVRSRWALTPDKIELIGGRLFWTEEDRLNMLALLLENVGVDAAIRLGSPQVWRAALARLET